MQAIRMAGLIFIALLGIGAPAGAQRADSLVLSDGARVRVSLPTRRTVTGTAFHWSLGERALLTAKGDTVRFSCDDRLEASLGSPGNYMWLGVALGVIGGAAATEVRCRGENSCREGSPWGLVGIAAGGLIGRRIKREGWIRIPPPGCMDGG